MERFPIFPTEAHKQKGELMMKHLKRYTLWLLLLVCTLSAAFAAAEGVYTAPDGTIRFAGRQSHIEPGGILPLSNGDLLLAVSGIDCFDSEQTGKARTWLCCLRPDGNELWHAPLHTEGGYVHNLTELPDGRVQVIIIKENGVTREYSIFQNGVPEPGTKRTITVEDPCRDREDVRSVYLNGAGFPGRILKEEIYDPDASTLPRILQLEQTDGIILWRLECTGTDMLLRGGLTTDGATLLYGHGAMAMVQDDGTVLWQRKSNGDTLSNIYLGAVQNNDGTFLLWGPGNIDNGNVQRSKGRKYVCIDPVNGQTLWEVSRSASNEQPARMDSLCRLPQGYLNAGSAKDYNGCAYSLLDDRCQEIAYWEDHRWPEAVHGNMLFLWQDKVWNCIILSSGAQHETVLVEVDIPET